ncbi:hypothetical protein DL93DRAFT_2148981 [Clavulina sp. PMI_390]|nr:hypothetical protein DL93DRAFT_2148981 [Clavulina sp. PMI_390]
MLYPPVRYCSTCKRPLKEPLRRKIVLFTLHSGTHAGYATSLYCRKCHLRYHPNYTISASTDQRRYYGGIPREIEVAKHFYVTSSLSGFFLTTMSINWGAASNCATTYNMAIAQSPHHQAARWPFEYSIQPNHIWNSFYLFSLLSDFEEREDRPILILPNSGEQDERLKAAVEERNAHIVTNGTEFWDHACQGCCLLRLDEKSGIMKKMRAVVVDGVTLGHPCCGVHNCTIPLRKNNRRFCETHSSLHSQCVVTGCSRPVEEGHQTCALAEHQALESARRLGGSAFFKLKRRFLRIIGRPESSTEATSDDLEEILDEEALEDYEDSEVKSSSGNKVPKARFGRRRTHNEQLVVSPCGIIIARATMFGAEGIEAHKAFLKSVFRQPSAVPDVIFYDNNCTFCAHLQKQNDHFFDAAILPVDVFHFECKHKVTDTFCQENCNPARYPALYDESGKWVFNSSAAEQTNSWINGYLPMVRDMLPHKYNFFLDEMIRQRNKHIVRKLTETKKYPYHLPLTTLFPPIVD